MNVIENTKVCGARLVLLGLAFSMMTTQLAFAKEDNASQCTNAAIERANNLFGVSEYGIAASDLTTCIKHRNNLKAVVAWNSAIIHPSNNGLQILNTRNLMNDWEQDYGMTSVQDYDVVVVAYGVGARWALSNVAYNQKFGTDNPSIDIVQSLIERGAKIYMCQNSMKGNGWKVDDLIDGVHMVPAGVTALVDFQYQGYTYIAP